MRSIMFRSWLSCDASDLGRCVGDKTPSGFPIHGHRPPTRRETGLHELNRGTERTKFLILRCLSMTAGGVGFSEKLFQEHSRLIRDTRQMIQTCSCEQGRPSCIGALPTMNRGVRRFPCSSWTEFWGHLRKATAQLKPLESNLFLPACWLTTEESIWTVTQGKDMSLRDKLARLMPSHAGHETAGKRSNPYRPVPRFEND